MSDADFGVGEDDQKFFAAVANEHVICTNRSAEAPGNLSRLLLCFAGVIHQFQVERADNRGLLDDGAVIA